LLLNFYAKLDQVIQVFIGQDIHLVSYLETKSTKEPKYGGGFFLPNRGLHHIELHLLPILLYTHILLLQSLELVHQLPIIVRGIWKRLKAPLSSFQ